MNFPISSVLRTGQQLAGGDMLPVWLLPLLFGGSQAASAAGGAISANKQRKSQEESLALDREQGLTSTALQESLADPFRQQTAQANAVQNLDRLERASYAPMTVNLPERYAKYKPTISGGYSWEPSDDVRKTAGALKQNVMAGRTAPSMTSPDNFGKTATLDIHGGTDPRTDAAFAGGAPVRENLGAPAAPSLTAITQPAAARGFQGVLNQTRARAQTVARTEEVAAFEAQNPGWTIDETGRVTRKAPGMTAITQPSL